MFAFDREYRLIAWNKAMERGSGLGREEVLGQNLFELFPFLKEVGSDHNYAAALAGNATVAKGRSYFIPETSRQGFYEGHYLPLRAGDEVVGGVAIIHDITEQQRAEAALHEQHQRLTFHVENSPLAVIEWDSDLRVSRWSESAEKLFGWAAAEVLGKHVSDWHFVFTEDLDAVAQVGQRQREGIEQHGFIYNRNYTKDNSVIHCEWYNSVLNDEDGALVSILSLVLDVTARKQAEEELARLLVREREARRHAESADRLKDEFLATLSHELRTPLTAVLGWASLVRAGDVPESEFGNALEIIERNARAQARLIDDLLDVSRIITGNLQLDLRALDLASVVEAVAESMRPSALAKGVALNLELTNGARPIHGDAGRLRQIIWNLLLNAIKFTPRGGSVSVGVDHVESSTRLRVSDTGEGISPEFLPFVFDRFRQEEGSIARKHGGLGLGLAVARHLVELHGGKIGAESKGHGCGATFTVELPWAAESAAVAEESETRRASNTNNPKQLTGLRVLVVEDDDDSRSLVTMMLTRQGANVTAAASTADALRAFAEGSPDVLVSDIGMPDEDGFELIRQLRERTSTIPAIALTGYATARDRERTLSAGYQTHLAKPIEPNELVGAIVNLMKR